MLNKHHQELSRMAAWDRTAKCAKGLHSEAPPAAVEFDPMALLAQAVCDVIAQGWVDVEFFQFVTSVLGESWVKLHELSTGAEASQFLFHPHAFSALKVVEWIAAVDANARSMRKSAPPTPHSRGRGSAAPAAPRGRNPGPATAGEPDLVLAAGYLIAVKDAPPTAAFGMQYA